MFLPCKHKDLHLNPPNSHKIPQCAGAHLVTHDWRTAAMLGRQPASHSTQWAPVGDPELRSKEDSSQGAWDWDRPVASMCIHMHIYVYATQSWLKQGELVLRWFDRSHQADGASESTPSCVFLPGTPEHFIIFFILMIFVFNKCSASVFQVFLPRREWCLSCWISYLTWSFELKFTGDVFERFLYISIPMWTWNTMLPASLEASLYPLIWMKGCLSTTVVSIFRSVYLMDLQSQREIAITLNLKLST